MYLACLTKRRTEPKPYHIRGSANPPWRVWQQCLSLLVLCLLATSAAQVIAKDPAAEHLSHRQGEVIAELCNATSGSVHSGATPPDIRINGANLERHLSSVLALPNQPLDIEYYPRNLNQALNISVNGKLPTNRLQQISESRWQYQPNADEQTHLDLCAGTFAARLLLWPSVRQPLLTQQYPSAQQAPSPSAYPRPTRFLSVASAEAGNRYISPHFQLNQFLPNPADNSAQHATGWPQFTLVSFALLEKLELIIDVLAQHGKPAPTLRILSSYRSPKHNAKVGGAGYSRHIYGDAVDFIVDTNFDGKMDDLNDDGAITRADLDWLTDRLARRSVPVSGGGTGSYESAGNAAAFLHLDARGRDHYWQ